MSEENPLELVSTPDLLNELMRRHEHAVFAGMKFRQGGVLVRSRGAVGNKITCAGLALWVSRFALAEDEKDCSDFNGEY